MLDERGVDYGVLTSIGLAIAAAAVLLFIFAMLRASEAPDRAIALEAAAAEVCGDIETVGSMAIPYRAERYYDLEGIDVSVSSGYVSAAFGNDTFIRPFAGRIVPGNYSANGTVLWNGPAGLREYLNRSCNATGTRESPVNGSVYRRIMDRARSSSVESPVKVPCGRPLIIEKTFIYATEGTETEEEPCVLVYPG